SAPPPPRRWPRTTTARWSRASIGRWRLRSEPQPSVRRAVDLPADALTRVPRAGGRDAAGDRRPVRHGRLAAERRRRLLVARRQRSLCLRLPAPARRDREHAAAV